MQPSESDRIRSFTSSSRRTEEFIKRLKSICFGTVVNAIAVTPFDVLKVRLQSQLSLSGNTSKIALKYPTAKSKNIIRFSHEFVRNADHFDGILVRHFVFIVGRNCQD